VFHTSLLGSATDPGWATIAVDALDRLLVDHAHCEMKAAANAVALAERSTANPKLARTLVALAREELAHFTLVSGELARRGIALTPPRVDAYAATLRRRAMASARGRARLPALADRLLVAALIEARSSERFELLARELGRRGMRREQAFYHELRAAEAGHHRSFVTLAVLSAGGAPARAHVERRLAELVAVEADLAATLGREPTIHG
jgi:tRNA-(ms[2]io[6]A)-hydroxylase